MGAPAGAPATVPAMVPLPTEPMAPVEVLDEPPLVPSNIAPAPAPAPAPMPMSMPVDSPTVELERDANQAGNAAFNLEHLKATLGVKLSGAAHEGPKIQEAIKGFVSSERANLQNLETELENAALDGV